MRITEWIAINCKFAMRAVPSDHCLELIKASQFKEAAAYFRSLPQESQGDVAADMARTIQTGTGGFAGWMKRDEAGEEEPSIPNMKAFWEEVKRLDLGWR